MAQAAKSNEWKLIYQEKWYKWVPMTLLSSVYDGFIITCCLGFLVVFLLAQFGVISDDGFDSEKYSWYLLPVVLLFAAWLGWKASVNEKNDILDLLLPGATCEGRFEKLEEKQFSGSHGGYHATLITVSGTEWTLPNRPLSIGPERYGDRLRLKYRRGSKTVTHLWLQQTG